MPGAQVHVLQGAAGGGALRVGGELLRVRHRRASSGAPWPGLVPQVTNGVIRLASRVTSASKRAPSSVGSVRHHATAASQSAPCGAFGRPLRYAKVVSSGAIMPALAPHSMDMLAMVIRPSMERARIASPRYSTMCPRPPPVPTWVISASTRSLAVTPGREPAGDVHGHRLRPALRQRLGGQHVLHLAGADAEGERAERAVGGGVRVAADDRHARLGETELRADHVHDALVVVAERVQPHPELGAVAAQRLDLRTRRGVGDGEQVATAEAERRVGVPGRGVVVLGREGQVGTAHPAPGEPQPVEGLRAGHLVQQVQVDVEQIRLTRGGPYDVRVPDLLGQGPRLRSDSHHLDILNSGR